MSDFKKSINYILNERLASPLWGTFILSWLVWNWKIVYITFIVSEKYIVGNRIEYIVSNCNNIWILLWGPIISTIGIIAILPLFSNLAFWVTAIYDKWKVDKKNKIDKKRLLTVEQSISIREQLRDQDERFERLISEKDNEIKLLKAQLDNSLETTDNPDNSNRLNKQEMSEIANKINLEFDNNEIDRAIVKISNNEPVSKGGAASAFLKHRLIHYKTEQGAQHGFAYYAFTERGELFKDFFYRYHKK